MSAKVKTPRPRVACPVCGTECEAVCDKGTWRTLLHRDHRSRSFQRPQCKGGAVDASAVRAAALAMAASKRGSADVIAATLAADIARREGDQRSLRAEAAALDALAAGIAEVQP